MKIKMKTLLASPDGVYPAGVEIDLPDNVALDLVKGGYAEALEAVKEVEITPKRRGRKKAVSDESKDN